MLRGAAIIIFVLTILVGTNLYAWTSSAKSQDKKPKPVTTQPAPENKIPVKKVVRRPVAKNVAPTVVKKEEPVASQPSTTPESSDAIIDSMLRENNFPEKSKFIAKEDEKNEKKSAEKLSPKKEKKSSEKKVLTGTLGVIALVVGLGWIVRFLQKRSGNFLTKGSDLRVLGQQALGFRSRAVVLQAYGRRYLVGVTAETVSLLADLDLMSSDEEPLEFVPEKNKRVVVEQKSEVPVPKTTPHPSRAADRVREKLKTLRN